GTAGCRPARRRCFAHSAGTSRTAGEYDTRVVAPTWARLKTVTASRCSGAVCSPGSRSEERLVVPEQVMRDVPGQRGGDGCLHHAPAGVGQPAPRSAGGRGEPVRPGQL